MTRYIAAYIATLIVFAAVDFVWLSSTANTLYRPALKEILLDDFRPAPAIVFYLLYVFGIVFFAVSPAMRQESVMQALILGAVLGVVAYGTYDLTNFATLKNWNTKLTVIDIIWGGFLTAIASAAGYLVSGWIERAMR